MILLTFFCLSVCLSVCSLLLYCLPYKANKLHIKFILKREIDSWLTNDFDNECVSDSAVVVPYNARVVAAVEQVRFIHPNAVPSVVPRYL